MAVDGHFGFSLLSILVVPRCSYGYLPISAANTTNWAAATMVTIDDGY
jgi:hypothetical protein